MTTSCGPRRAILSVSLAAILGACDALPTAETSEPPTPLFSASVETLFRGWFPLTPPPGGVFNACTGEDVLVSGEFNLTVRRVTSASGHIQFRVHTNAQARGVGVITGTEYISNEGLNLTQNASPTGATVIHLIFNINTVSKGPLPDASGTIKNHITIDPDGTVVVSRSEIAFDVCRG